VKVIDNEMPLMSAFAHEWH